MLSFPNRSSLQSLSHYFLFIGGTPQIYKTYNFLHFVVPPLSSLSTFFFFVTVILLVFYTFILSLSLPHYSLILLASAFNLSSEPAINNVSSTYLILFTFLPPTEVPSKASASRLNKG